MEVSPVVPDPLAPRVPDQVPPDTPLAFTNRGEVGLLVEAREVLRELVEYAVILLIEACFMCIWAGVVWCVYHVLEFVERGMPKNEWAPTLFKYAEIGFAVFILCKLFLNRAQVFELAL